MAARGREERAASDGPIALLAQVVNQARMDAAEGDSGAREWLEETLAGVRRPPHVRLIEDAPPLYRVKPARRKGKG